MGTVTFFSILSALYAVSALADPRICVQNYATGPRDLCAMGAPVPHKYVIPEDRSETKVCAMTYDDERCKFNKIEFAHARTASGLIVCVLNFNQPSVTGNFCATQPGSYSYVYDPWK